MGQNVQLLLGDCVVRMRGLPEASVDEIVSDPPYGISFMGRGWDQMGDGAKQRRWHKDWCEAAYHVLKPGGQVKAFSGTRTFHHMAAALVAAGFVLEDLEAWSYGCLPADAEILTENGWKLGIQVKAGERVACWDSETNAIQLEPAQEVTLAPYNGDLVAFKNDNTDQLLTPNHRVYKKDRSRKMVGGARVSTVEGAWSVTEAGKINRWNNILLPLAGTHDGPGIGGLDLVELLGWVWSEGGFDKVGTGVRITQSSSNQTYVDVIDALVSKMIPSHKHYTRDRIYTRKDGSTKPYTEHTWFFSGEMALRVRELLPDKHPTWDLIWRMTSEEKWTFMWAAIRGDGSSKRGKIHVDGSRGPVHYNFNQKCASDLIMFQTLCHLTGHQGRINWNKNVVGVHHNPTTQFQGRHLKAKVSEHYEGMVWCVRVPTGAFVARRKDQVFITGNSGFPKSMNVSKQLDKQAGAVREMKQIPHTGNGMMRHGGENTRPWIEEALKTGFHTLPGDKPVTEEAVIWNGWGTALKPAWEPVLIARKPL